MGLSQHELEPLKPGIPLVLGVQTDHGSQILPLCSTLADPILEGVTVDW